MKMMENTLRDLNDLQQKIAKDLSVHFEEKFLLESLTLKGEKILAVVATSNASPDLQKEVETFLKSHLQESAKGHELALLFTAHKAGPSFKKVPLPQRLAEVKYIIAVASGKGGVGKSTTALSLAFAFKEQGLKVGLLDADIYGPSLPRLLGVNEAPRSTDLKKILPITAFGLKCISMGFMVPEDKAIIWRGPMVQTAVYQLLFDVDWGPLDLLIVDMPPGTGDAQLTLMQKVVLSGGVVISTPQDLALLDAKRAVAMFEEVKVPVLGLIENMSFFKCLHCREEHRIFGTSPIQEIAPHHEVLGHIPLTSQLAQRVESGEVFFAESGVKEIYKEIALKLWQKLEER